MLKGTIYIVNTENRIGRIWLDDGRESQVMKFPESFDTGDRAEVQFLNDDPYAKLINLVVPGDHWHYGHMRGIPGQNMRSWSVLVTSPRLKGLIKYQYSNINTTLGDLYLGKPVKLRIRKSMSGEVVAVDLTEVETEERFKCYPPFFGKIESQHVPVQIGFVSDIVTSRTGLQKLMNGKVCEVRVVNPGQQNEYYIGFIQPSGNTRRVYFNSISFETVFKKKPQVGLDVLYSVRSTEKGMSVDRFYKEAVEQSLPKEQQYGLIKTGTEDARFLLQDYERAYKKTAVVGDIVQFIRENTQVILTAEGIESIQKYYLVRDNKEMSKSDPPVKGLIDSYNTRAGYGFIRTVNRESFFFHISTYLDAFTDIPVPQMEVSVNIGFNEEKAKYQVDRFVNLTNRLECRKDNFVNFVEHDPNALYYAYQKDSRTATEIRKVDTNDLSEAISCYKDNHLGDKEKLEAIDTIIGHMYQDKWIKTTKLMEEKKHILSDIIDVEIANGSLERALHYECIYQQLDYQPLRFSKFRNSKEPVQMYLVGNSEVHIDDEQESWQIMLEPGKQYKNLESKESYMIELSCPDLSLMDYSLKEVWDIELDSPRDVKPIQSDVTYYELTI